MNQNLINIKGTKHGLIFYFSTNGASFKELCEALENKLAGNTDFFTNAVYLISPDNDFTAEEQEELEKKFSKYNLTKGDPPKPESFIYFGDEVQSLGSDGNSVFIKASIRSGQKVDITGNAIIIGDINNGGEVIASGNIIILGTCRGLLHAGSQGDRDAIIIVSSLYATQIRIADIVYFEDEAVKERSMQIISCKNEEIVFEEYMSSNF